MVGKCVIDTYSGARACCSVKSLSGSAGHVPVRVRVWDRIPDACGLSRVAMSVGAELFLCDAKEEC
jgi:hypothetical protein